MTTLNTSDLSTEFANLDLETVTHSALNALFNQARDLLENLNARVEIDHTIHGGPPLRIAIDDKSYNLRSGIRAVIKKIDHTKGFRYG